jgi:hypothetical protein
MIVGGQAIDTRYGADGAETLMTLDRIERAKTNGTAVGRTSGVCTSETNAGMRPVRRCGCPTVGAAIAVIGSPANSTARTAAIDRAEEIAGAASRRRLERTCDSPFMMMKMQTRRSKTHAPAMQRS